MTTLLFIVGVLVATAALALWSVPVAGVFLGVILMAAGALLELAKIRAARPTGDAS